MDKCFVETLQGSTECLKVNSEKRSNEGNKVKQPEEDEITQEMAEETHQKESDYLNKAYKKPPVCERSTYSKVQFWSEHRWQN